MGTCSAAYLIKLLYGTISLGLYRHIEYPVYAVLLISDSDREKWINILRFV